MREILFRGIISPRVRAGVRGQGMWQFPAILIASITAICSKGDKPEPFVDLDAPFPLTLTLSPGERECCRPVRWDPERPLKRGLREPAEAGTTNWNGGVRKLMSRGALAWRGECVCVVANGFARNRTMPIQGA